MRVPTSLRWVGLALLGLVIAAIVAIAASRLASQQIGIASESVSAGDSLAPPITTIHRRRPKDGERAAEAGEGPASTAEPRGSEEAGEAAPPTTPLEPSESSEPEPPAATPPAEPAPDDSGGGAGNDGGGGRDD